MKKTIWYLLVILWLLPVGSQPWAQVRISPSDWKKVEPHIAINPTDPRNIVVVAITDNNQPLHPRIGAWYTTNQGADWYGYDDIVGPSSPCGDPVVAFDGYETAYVLYRVRADRKLYLQKSTNGGVNWSIRSPVFDAGVGLTRWRAFRFQPRRSTQVLKSSAWVEEAIAALRFRQFSLVTFPASRVSPSTRDSKSGTLQRESKPLFKR